MRESKVQNNMEITAGMTEPVIQLVNFFQAIVELIILYGFNCY